MRYCEIDAAKKLNCLSPSTSPKLICGAAEDVAVARDADVDRRSALEKHLLERASSCCMLSWHQRVLQRRLEVDDRAGRAEVRRGTRCAAAPCARACGCCNRPCSSVMKAIRLRAAFVEHHRRPVAAERVGVLAQLAGLQIERPDVVDVAVLRDLGLERHGRIGRGRREHDRVVVDELRARSRPACRT